MFGFLQGFAYGLFISCMPWFIAGMINPGWAVPNDPPRRWQVFLRYGFIIPFIVVLTWVTSLWGGFEPSLLGWLAGLAAVPTELFVERRWRRWRERQADLLREQALDRALARERARLEQQERESGLRVLDPARPPTNADDIVLALAETKQRLLDARRPDMAMAADRIYSRYGHVRDVIGSKFDRREMTYERATGLVSEVCRSALDTLQAMASLAHGVAGIDADFVKRRLQREGDRLPAPEREALQRRLQLVDDTEAKMRTLGASIEAALTALDDTAVAVSAVETARSQAAVDADQALQDLRRFVERTPSYSRSS